MRTPGIKSEHALHALVSKMHAELPVLVLHATQELLEHALRSEDPEVRRLLLELLRKHEVKSGEAPIPHFAHLR